MTTISQNERFELGERTLKITKRWITKKSLVSDTMILREPASAFARSKKRQPLQVFLKV